VKVMEYGWILWCDTCDHGYLNSEWDHDARMCKDCASEMEKR
jgi:uncharacterized protein (DUF983 family)